MVEYLTSLKAKFEYFELSSDHLRNLREFSFTGILVGVPITSVTAHPFTVSASIPVKAIDVEENETLGGLHLKFSDIYFAVKKHGMLSYEDAKLSLRFGDTYAETTFGEFLKLCRERR